MRGAYRLGRVLQALGLLAMPSAIWAGVLKHDERSCITIFLASLLVFYTGYFLTRLDARL